MKLLSLVILTALCWIGANAFDDAFEKFWEKDVKFNKHFLAQHKLDKLNNLTLHMLPKEHAFQKQTQTSDCPEGFTGVYCESPICFEKIPVVGHDIRTTMIEKQVVESCRNSVTIYVDSHLYFVRISVQTESPQTHPGGQLYDSNMNKIFADSDKSKSGNIHIYDYRDLVDNFGPGVYTFAATSETDEDCMVTAFSATPMVVYGGFVESARSDKVQEEPPTGDSVQKNPWVDSSFYFGFSVTNTTVNDAPKYVSFHRKSTELQFAPLPVRPRYSCNADQFVGPYTCLEEGDFLLKVRGTDFSGNVWQRVYNFNCDSNPYAPQPSTASPEPILECQNGGTLIKQRGQNVCYCGPHFTGDICQIKMCRNGGYVDEEDDCICTDGFGGRYCEHVQCTDREENFRLDKRGLTFVVRANKNSKVVQQVQRAANKIINYFDDTQPGTFEEYALVLVVNGEFVAVKVTTEQDDFLSEIANTADLWNETSECQDKVYVGLDEALTLSTTTKYLKSPIFLFTDATTSDDQSTIIDLSGRLSKFKNPVFTIFYGGSTDKCDVKTTDEGYKNLQYIAQYNHGIVVHTTLNDDDISDTAFALATGFFNNNLLIGYDLINSCQYAPDYHLFFVDETVQAVTVAHTGPAGLHFRVIDTDEKKINPERSTSVGDLQLATYTTLTKGHYRLAIGTNGLTGACVYRVYAQTHYEAFFAATTTVNVDRAFYQPIYNQDVHLVGLVNYVDFPDPENLKAEVVIWEEDTTILDPKQESRKVIYASNGVYRDGCSYNLYFGQWKCTKYNGMFYANIYVTDSTGFTVLRTTTGQCVMKSGPPEEGCRNGGVSYKGKCLCTAGWGGDKCEKAKCYNNGTSRGDHCDCLVGYGGQHCELYKCINKNEAVKFESKNIMFALIVQNSRDMVSPLMKMASLSEKIVNNLKATHKNWISLYSFWEFDNQTYDYVTKSPFVDEIIYELNEFTDKRRSKPYICKNLLVLDVLIQALSDESATRNMEVFLYVYGGLVIDVVKQKKLFRLIDELEAKIHVIQSNNIRCYPDGIDTPEVEIISSLAYYSGGTYSLSGDGGTLLSLPLHYSSSNLYNEIRSNCTGRQVFYFPVDSEAQTLSFSVYGDLKGDPKFLPSDDSDEQPIKVFGGQIDRLYVSLRGCQEGWVKFEDQCLRYEPVHNSTKVKTWNDAHNACVELNATLVAITNSEINTFISTFIGSVNSWIGLNDKKKRGSWEWDQGSSQSIPLQWNPKKSYNGFKNGEPKVDNGQCVAYSSSGWFVTNCSTELGYLCSKNAFSLLYDPDDPTEGHLPRGLWTVKFETYAGDDLPCGLRVDAQSGLQVFRRFDSSPFADDGPGQALSNFDYNYQLVHVDSSVDQFDERSTLEYAHFYPSNNPDLAFVSKLSPREGCSYEYVSDAFSPTQLAYMVAYTGFDAYGYPYQRIIPTIVTNNSVSCTNGGVKALKENRCVCPPNFTGADCSQPICVNGILSPNRVKCRCIPGFVGDFCEFSKCTRGSGIDPAPIANINKTFTLILDGSFTDYNGPFLNNFKNILDNTLNSLQAVESVWFKNYVAIVAYDSDPAITSSIINKHGRTDFETAVLNVLNNTYKAKTKERRFMRALAKVIKSDAVEVGSPIYIITDSAISDYHSFNEDIYNLIAQKHISTIILNDQKVPGGKHDYREDSVSPYLWLAFNTGGGFYQVPSSNELAGFWSGQLTSYFSSYGLAHSLYHKCSDKIEYFQIGGVDSNIIVDIFSAQNQTITMYDPNDQKVNPTKVRKTKTNFLFSTPATKPGIWRININHYNKTDFCAVAVRSIRSDAPVVGFNNDIGVDRGLHSQGATYAPIAGPFKNSIIAFSKTDLLRYVHVYTHDTGELVFTSPLLRRTDDCKWNYVSKFLFTCPDSSFTVAVEGSDPAGYQFRRLYKTHCIGYSKRIEDADTSKIKIDTDIQTSLGLMRQM